MSEDRVDIALRLDHERTPLRELTAEKLREAILSGRLMPGERLVERDLCDRTGVSRSSLREALRILEAEALVERQGPRGLFVTSISVEEAAQIYEVRAALEPEMARLCAERADAGTCAVLELSLSRLEVAIAERSIVDYVQALDDFFDGVVRGACNQVAVKILSGLRARIKFLRTVTTARADTRREERTLELMRVIAADIARGDGPKAHIECRAFIDRSATFALDVLRNPHDRSILVPANAKVQS
jgi:DNA-binding GntR family transcriptional regulator